MPAENYVMFGYRPYLMVEVQDDPFTIPNPPDPSRHIPHYLVPNYSRDDGSDNTLTRSRLMGFAAIGLFLWVVVIRVAIFIADHLF